MLDAASVVCITSTCHAWYDALTPQHRAQLQRLHTWNGRVSAWLSLLPAHVVAHPLIARPQFRAVPWLSAAAAPAAASHVAGPPLTHIEAESAAQAHAHHAHVAQAMVRLTHSCEWRASIPCITFTSAQHEYDALSTWYGMWSVEKPHGRHVRAATQHMLLLPRAGKHRLHDA